jgi:hypothetical protein
MGASVTTTRAGIESSSISKKIMAFGGMSLGIPRSP